jgi:intracellular sulfur oxidation DsrE/DsrF family protein
MRLLGVVLLVLLALSPLALAQPPALRIDVPVKLAQAKVVFNLDHLAFEGDNPTGLNFIHIMLERFAEAGTKHDIVAIFHGAAGYWALADARYNEVRKTPRGNPYRTMIAALATRGAKFELCAETAKANGWTNADLLSGVKVTTAANLRIIELVQQGYVQVQP